MITLSMLALAMASGTSTATTNPPPTTSPTTVLPNLSISPGDTMGVPGTAVLGHLANGMGYYALIAAMIGVVVGGVIWAFGHYSQNYQQAFNGRKGVLVSGLAALLIGAAPHLVNFFVAEGGKVQ